MRPGEKVLIRSLRLPTLNTGAHTHNKGSEEEEEEEESEEEEGEEDEDHPPVHTSTLGLKDHLHPLKTGS